MKRLLLISNSTQHGGGFLEHCAADIREFLGSAVREVTFVGYARLDLDGYAATAERALAQLGYRLRSVHTFAEPAAAVRDAEALFIGGGNTFRLLTELYRHGLIAVIGERVLGGMPYIGVSAGTVVACPTIQTTNDMPIVYPPSFAALGLIPLQINAHYLDPDPGSTHMGETREVRIREYHETNETPVVGLREGAMLRGEGQRITMSGRNGGVLFERGKPLRPLAPGVEIV
ncbi:MAG: dipeptidase PepE [Planctomycetes bacterium]|nr:dipeptidase PepE [Planctomycetota bacterium]MCB9871815.1 dipeptidase PepE [Planctomycetota bacterium]MCB9889679.1 dipeptidase PepE [Planctomycetota bacterium]